MNYDREILFILGEAGERGLSIQKIARHVFNNHNNFFESVSFDEVHRCVAAFLKRNSRTSGSIIERTEVRGVYRINLFNTSRQLYFDFKDEVKETNEGEKTCEDKSLTLF